MRFLLSTMSSSATSFGTRKFNTMRLLYYNPLVATQKAHWNLPGMRLFSNYFRIYNAAVVPIDRSGIITVPISTTSLFPLPTVRPFTHSYEEVCNIRAQELLQRADAKAVPIYIFWSGGIDSTLVTISLLKNATEDQKKNITLLLSEDSIAEYPNFYRDHIHRKIKTESSNMFPYLMGGNYLIVNGEHNDQIFGSDAIAKFMMRFGDAEIHKKYSRDTYFTFFNETLDDAVATNQFLDLFERLIQNAPVPILRNYDFLWWINFSLKWQNVFMRTLSYTAPRNRKFITMEYIRTLYAPFYNTEEFQLWSMLNPDKKIKDTWKTYKWAAKQVIYDYTNDANYRDNKIKKGSLAKIVMQQGVCNFIDDTMQFHDALDVNEYYDPANNIYQSSLARDDSSHILAAREVWKI